MSQKIIIDMGENDLVLESNVEPFEKEVMCYIQNKQTKMIMQDVAIIRPSYSFKNDASETPDFSESEVEVLVYGDEQYEDYTDKFVIPLLEEED